jgi:hypothetical protein
VHRWAIAAPRPPPRPPHRPPFALDAVLHIFWISSKCGVSFLSHVGFFEWEAQINLFKLVIAFYLTFDPKRVVRDF